MADRERILILCTGNSARSQIGEGLLRHIAGDRVEALSAGSRPAAQVNPYAVRAMAEIGIDIAGQRPKHISEFAGQRIDWVIAVCSRAAQDCPFFPGARATLHWFYDDPAAVQGSDEEIMGAFRALRDDLVRRLTAWLALPPDERENDSGPAGTPLTLIPPARR